MKTIKELVVQMRRFLFFGALLIWSATVFAVPCSAQNKDQAARPARIEITIVSVKPEMLMEFENTVKNELNPGLAKGGIKWNDVWRTAGFGNEFDYIFVSPIDNLAEYDGPGPLVKGLGKEAANAWYAKASKMVNNVRAMAYEVREDLSYITKMTAPPKMAVVSYVSIAPGRTAEAENFIKNDLLPVVQKSGIAGYWVHKTLFGGDVNEYLTVTLMDNFADMEKGPPQVRVLGQEGAAKLMQKMPAGVIVKQERIVSRYVPELSYRPTATATK